jgi:peptidoglycan/LPS O-acetylase OafA/YrhL
MAEPRDSGAHGAAEMPRDWCVPVTASTPAPAPTPGGGSQGEKPCLDAFNGLRGIAACVVVVGHLLTYWTGDPSGPAFPAFGLDYLSAVSLFFVISGFTLVAIYDKEAGGQAPFSAPGSTRVFLRRRVARLLPLYFLGLALDIGPLIVYYPPIAWAFGVPIALLGLQSMTCGQGIVWNGPLWTVSAFFWCYLSFPTLLRRLRVHRPAVLRGILALVLAICAALPAVWIPLRGWTSAFCLHTLYLFRLPQFVAGMIAGLLARQSPVASPRRLLWISVALLVASVVACATITGVMQGFARYEFFNVYPLYAEFVTTALFVSLLMALSSARVQDTVVARFLRSRPLAYLGDVSYALYCTHWPVLAWSAWAVAAKGVSMAAVPAQTEPGGWFFFPVWAIAVLLPVTLLVAAAAHHVLERPARKAIAGAAAQPAAAAAATATVS